MACAISWRGGIASVSETVGIAKIMDIYSIGGDPRHLVLVKGTYVINGNWKLEKRHGGYFVPHTHFPMQLEFSDIDPYKYEEDCWPSHQKGWIDYNTTLDKAEKILLERLNENHI